MADKKFESDNDNEFNEVVPTSDDMPKKFGFKSRVGDLPVATDHHKI